MKVTLPTQFSLTQVMKSWMCFLLMPASLGTDNRVSAIMLKRSTDDRKTIIASSTASCKFPFSA